MQYRGNEMQIQKNIFFEGLTPPQEGQWGFPQND